MIFISQNLIKTVIQHSELYSMISEKNIMFVLWTCICIITYISLDSSSTLISSNSTRKLPYGSVWYEAVEARPRFVFVLPTTTYYHTAIKLHEQIFPCFYVKHFSSFFYGPVFLVWQVWKWRVWEWQVYFTVKVNLSLSKSSFSNFSHQKYRT